jgi:DNA (cytosine-5)-methyltransferase 1
MENDPSFTITKGHSHAVAFTQNTRDEVRYINGDGSIAGAAQPGMKQTTYLAYGLDEEQNGMEELMGCLKSRMKGGGFEGTVAKGLQVRRLTPIECARLQGFPDTYLDIQFRNKPAADGNKYKALGNSMAVPVMRYIGQRIKAVLGEPFNIDDLI